MDKVTLNTGLTIERVLIDYTDLTDTAGVAKTLTIRPHLRPGSKLLGATPRLRTAFVGCATLVLDIGYSGSGNAAINDFDLKGALNSATDSAALHVSYSHVAEWDITATITSSSENLTELTAGFVEVDLLLAHVVNV